MFAAARVSALRHTTSPLSRATSSQQPASLRRLLSSLALLEHHDGKLNNSSLAAVTAAMRMGGSITGLVAGGDAKSVADQAAKVKGIEKVLFVENDAYNKVCGGRNVMLRTKLCSHCCRDLQRTMRQW